MDKEEIFDNEQLELLLKELQDIDKFTGFKDGAFKYELGKYQANLLVGYIKKQKEVIDKAIEYIKEKQKIQYKFALSHIECDDLLDILKEVSE